MVEASITVLNRVGNERLVPSLGWRSGRQSADEIGHNRPDDDFGLHSNRNTPIIVGKPHPDVALVEEETLERHDDQHTGRFNLPPRAADSLNLFNAHVQFAVFFIVIHIHRQRLTLAVAIIRCAHNRDRR